MLTVCAKHVVVKEASSVAAINLIVVTIGESLELQVVGTGSYIYKFG